LKVSLNRGAEVLNGVELIPYSAVTRKGADRIWKEISKRTVEG
jgi:hypothetical protein